MAREKALRDALACALAIAAIGLGPIARADDAKNLDRTDARGFGDTTVRIGGSFTRVTGARPDANASSVDYQRNQYTIDFDAYGFWDVTRFDTLIGAEFLARIGLGDAEQVSGAADNPSGQRWFFRSDGAFDYAILHWDGDVRGRLAFGAGGGMDFGPRWYANEGRFYPLIVARAQLWFGDLGVHASWHHLPTTTGDLAEREHRFELGVGSGTLHGGVRYTLTRVLHAYPDGETANQRELGIYLMAAF